MTWEEPSPKGTCSSVVDSCQEEWRMGSSSGAYSVAASMTLDLGHSPNAFLTSVLTIAILAMGAEAEAMVLRRLVMSSAPAGMAQPNCHGLSVCAMRFWIVSRSVPVASLYAASNRVIGRTPVPLAFPNGLTAPPNQMSAIRGGILPCAQSLHHKVSASGPKGWSARH